MRLKAGSVIFDQHFLLKKISSTQAFLKKRKYITINILYELGKNNNKASTYFNGFELNQTIV